MIIINAENMIVGKFATIAAKQSLLGQDVAIVNCEKACVSGKKESVFAAYKEKKDRGTHKGPNLPRASYRIVKRMIRGMLPYKQPRGRIAFERIKCYNGIPTEFEGKEFFPLSEKASVKKLPNLKYVSIGELSKFLGAKE